jgi:hypothetical protein
LKLLIDVNSVSELVYGQILVGVLGGTSSFHLGVTLFAFDGFRFPKPCPTQFPLKDAFSTEGMADAPSDPR